MRIVYMGTPDFAVYPLESLVNNGFNVVAVYTQPDRESGRGRSLTPTPVKIAAEKYGIPVYQPSSIKSAGEIETLAGLKPDVIVVAAFGQILRRIVLEMAPHGCINLHPSLLPKYRGVAPVYASLLAGDSFTGVSIMKLDTGIDTGPVLARTHIKIMDWDTTATLTDKASYIGAELLTSVLPLWAAGKIVPQAQGDSPTPYTRMVEKADGEIDWTKSAEVISRQIRACQPWPGAFSSWKGNQLKIIEAKPFSAESTNPGIVNASKITKGMYIDTGDGYLEILKVQLQGKRVMSGPEFIRGQQNIIGAIIPC